jgi:AcrR family transcriptional regulator
VWRFVKGRLLPVVRGGRTAKGLATRARIVESAARRFVAEGYMKTTVADIAQDSGLSPQAVYLAFGSKAAILSAVFAAAADGQDDAEGERSWQEQLENCPDAASALDIALKRGTDFVERTGPIHDVCLSAAADPEVAKLLEDLGQQRMAHWHEVATLLARKEGFRSSQSVQRACGALYMVVGPEPWRALTKECGWSTQEWRDFIRQSARAYVLQDAPAPVRPLHS